MLTGSGDRAFCAGGDLKEMADTTLEVPPPDFLPQFGRNIDVPKPTIAAVNGVAYAGGFLLAQNCDLCVAADTATFAITEVKVGRGAPWAAPLSWLVPPKIALEILLTGDPITAQRAYEVGLVNRVVPLADLRDTAQTLAERIAANAPLSVLAAKRTAYLGRRRTRSTRPNAIWEPVYRSARRAGGPGRLPRQTHPSLDGTLMAIDMSALVADLADESADLDTMLTPLDEAAVAPRHAGRRLVASPIRSATSPTSTRPRSLPPSTPDRFRREAARVDGRRRRLPGPHRRPVPRDAGSGVAGVAARHPARRSCDTFATIEPGRRLPWYGPDMSAASSVTARLMETWAHGQDIADTLGRARPATNRLRHVAHLGVSTIGFCYALNGLPAPTEPIRVEVTGPDGDLWAWGPARCDQRRARVRPSTSASSSRSGGTATTPT